MLYLPEMNEALRSLFTSLAPFDEEELQQAASRFYVDTIPKNKFFCKAGIISDRIGFVSSGLLRSFYNIKEKENTSFFHTPGSVAVALLSFVKLQPAIENIQAIEDSEMTIINRKSLHQLYQNNWKWQQVGRILTEEYYVNLEQRSITLQSQTAQERYSQFLEDYPDLIKTVPLHYIASFLGMSPETLSRIRKTV